jgi:succinoglycan biosynthesis protein ExoW
VARISVVIPYFQCQPGILEKALASIFEQRLPENCLLRVIIVDDESPSPPELDLAKNAQAPISVCVIKRANGGPGAARNTGLDTAPTETDFIAFLDSDDLWVPDHLQRALTTLGDDADFYFSDQQTASLGGHSTYFEGLCKQFSGSNFGDSKLPSPLVAPDLRAPVIAPYGPEGSFEFLGRDGLTILIRSFLPHISCTVIRARRLGHLRFRADLKNAGEDYLYFLMLADAARKVCYSNRVGAIRGHGVNMFHSSVSWTNDRSWFILADNLRCLLYARAILSLDAHQAAILDRRISFRRLEMAARALSDMRRFKLPPLDRIFQADQGLFVRFPLLLVRALWRKAHRKPVADYLRASELS